MALIDSHAHLNDPRFAPDRSAVLERARLAGVTGIVNVGYDLPSSRLAVEIAEREPDCWAVVGVHPHDAALVDDSVLADLRNMAQGGKVVGIGESGLDYFRNLSPPEVQQQVFARVEPQQLAGEAQVELQRLAALAVQVEHLHRAAAGRAGEPASAGGGRRGSFNIHSNT
jgi:Tat protein secretion system quality control protein TatD with DNase activity